MEKILDFSQPVDVALFDQVIAVLSTGAPADIMRAQEILTEFQNNPDAFFRVDALLTQSKQMATRFFALQVLDNTILKRWNALSEENQRAIRNFVLNLIVQECTSFQHIRQNRALLTKMNSTLVSIAKREWPLRWPNFIKDITSSAGPEIPMVENNLQLLRLVGEEVFQFGEKTLTSRWIERKKQALAEDASYIMALCRAVILASQDTALLKVALQTLQVYVPWTPASLVFDEAVLHRIAELAVGDDNVRTAAVCCLGEICSAKTESGANGDQQTQLLLRVFKEAFLRIISALPTTHSSVMERTVQLYEAGSSVDQEYLSQLNLLLITFLRHYILRIAYDDVLLVAAHEMLVGMSNIYEKELFKSCVEYWWWLGDLLVRSSASSAKRNLQAKLPRVLSDVRYVLIKRMAKPEEVIIVEDEGELRREHVQDVEELQMYQLMREALVFLTVLNSKDTYSIMLSLMQRQLDRSEWSWHNCNTLCWAVGAISMTLPIEEENELFGAILRGLLQLCKEMQGKDNRAVIASNVLFVVGQYPRYLRNHPQFLATVTRKVFEFMRETFPGVQDMSVDTFLKLARLLADRFVECRGGVSFAQEVSEHWSSITSLLSFSQVETCFQAVGCFVAAEEKTRQVDLLARFLQDTNANFKALAEQAAQQREVFCRDTSLMSQLLHDLRVFSNIADTCGNAFIHEMSLIIQDLYGFYRMFSDAQARIIAEFGPQALSHQDSRYLRLNKREILRVFERFVNHTEELDFVSANCMPEVFTVVLLDYENSVPAAKEAQVMALAAACVRSLGERLTNECAAILDHTFSTTVAMISDSMESYPEFRVNLFQLLQALNAQCFPAFLNYTAANEDVLGGLLWATKHTDFPTMKTGLETLDLFLENVATSELAEAFYSGYIQRIFVEILVAAMDSLHASGFPYHCSILQKLFAISDIVPVEAPVLGRQAILQFLLENLTIIPTLTPTSIEGFVQMCYDSYNDNALFRTRFADFLIESQVWGAEQENRLQEDEERRQREQEIPGFARPTIPRETSELQQPSTVRVQFSPIGGQRFVASAPTQGAAMHPPPGAASTFT